MNRERVAVGLALAAGAFFRFTALSRQSLWSDEIATLLVAAKPLPKVLATIVLTDLHPPLFYLLAHCWQYLGHGETTLRLLPALCGVASLFVGWRIARRLLGPRAAVAAVWLGALWPAHVYYSGEFRPHALAVLLGLLSFALLPAAAGGDRRARGGYLAVTVAGLYTDYLVLHLVAAQIIGTWNMDHAARRVLHRRIFRPALLCFIPGFLMLAWQLVHRNFSIKLLGGDADPLWNWLTIWSFGGIPWRETTFTGFLDRIYDRHDGLFPWLYFALALPGLALLLNGARLAWREKRSRILVWWAFVPPVALSLASLAAPVAEAKYLLVTLPAAAMLLGLGVTGRRNHPLSWLGLGFWLALAVLALAQHRADPRYFRDDWRGVARDLVARLEPGDVVLGATFELRHYASRPLPEDSLLATSPREFVRRGFKQDPADTAAQLERTTAAYDRLWFEPSPVPDTPVMSDAALWLADHLYETTPPEFAARRPAIRRYVADRARYAAWLAAEAPTRLDFRADRTPERWLRGRWLPTAEGWQWTSNGAGVWLRKPPDADTASVLVFVNTDLYRGAALTVRLLVEGEPVAAVSADRTDQYRLTGPLPARVNDRPAVELAVRTDRIIWQDQRPDIAPEAGRTLLVGEAAVFRATP
ncbi:MAG: hypothetical protein GX444_06245 [Myxococcales bacterium]|nr:hypothetical protein [Myxococcales bacterium]